MKTIYLMKHSETIGNVKHINLVDKGLTECKKAILSVDGEYLAKSISEIDEFKDIDAIYTSDYARTIGTAKYFAYANHIPINIDCRLGERIYTKRITADDRFLYGQFLDENQKGPGGESQLDVKKRMLDAVNEILDTEFNNILIVSHSNAIVFFLMNYFKLNLNEFCGFKILEFVWKGKVVINGTDIRECDTYKLVFDDNHNLIEFDIV